MDTMNAGFVLRRAFGPSGELVGRRRSWIRAQHRCAGRTRRSGVLGVSPRAVLRRQQAAAGSCLVLRDTEPKGQRRRGGLRPSPGASQSSIPPPLNRRCPRSYAAAPSQSRLRTYSDRDGQDYVMEMGGCTAWLAACAMGHKGDEGNQSRRKTHGGSGAGWEGSRWLRSQLPQPTAGSEGEP
jgi:hypothetical protein